MTSAADSSGDLASACEALARALAQAGPAEGVLCAYLHGSRVTGTARPDSDFDLAVFLGRPPGPERIRRELELGARLEALAGLGPVDLRFVDDAPLRVRGKALTAGKLLYSSDEAARVALERDTRIAYLDYLPRARRLDEELLRRVAAEGL